MNLLNAALAHAVLENNLEVVKEALSKGADANQTLKLNNYKKPFYLIENPKKYQDPKEEERHLISVAAELHNNFDMVLALWPQSRNKGLSFTTRAAFSAKEKGLKFFQDLKKEGVVLKNIKDANGNTLLHYYFHSFRNLNLLKHYYTPTLKFLIEEGCDINALNLNGEAPLHRIHCFSDKELQKKFNIITPTLDLGLKKTDGDTVLKNLVLFLPINTLLKLLEDKKVSLSLREFATFRSRLHYIKNQKNLKRIMKLVPWDDYPLIKDLAGYIFQEPLEQKRLYNLAFSCYLPFVVEQGHTTLKTKNMTDLVFSLSKTKSPRVIKVLQNYYTALKEANLFSFLGMEAVFELSLVFMKKDKENPSDLLDFLENKDCFHNFMLFCSNKSPAERRDFLSSFSQEQIKTLFSMKTPKNGYFLSETNNYSIDWSYRCLFSDSLNHFCLFPEKMKTALKEQDFNNINTFKKLHDFLTREGERLQHALFDLEQERKHPALTSLEPVMDYEVKVASTNHELMDWGRTLGNCIGGGYYSQKALKGDCILLGLKKEGNIAYTVEIVGGRIIQFEGPSRSRNETLLKALQVSLETKKILRKAS